MERPRVVKIESPHRGLRQLKSPKRRIGGGRFDKSWARPLKLIGTEGERYSDTTVTQREIKTLTKVHGMEVGTVSRRKGVSVCTRIHVSYWEWARSTYE